MSTSNVVTERQRFETPDLTSTEAIEQYSHALSECNNRGVATLQKHLRLYTRTLHILQGHHDHIEASLRYLNGKRAVSGPRSVQKAALKFLSSLNTPQLRQQCIMWQLDYDGFETQEEVIDALIKMQTTA